MTDFPLVPIGCDAILTRLSRRARRLRVSENGEFSWLYVSHNDEKERIAWDFFYELQRLDFLELDKKSLKDGTEVADFRLTDLGKHEFDRYTGADVERKKSENWKQCLETLDLTRLTNVDALIEPLPRIPGVSDLELIQAHLACLDGLINTPYAFTLRSLSAQYFWGLSKYLERLGDKYLLAIYGDNLRKLAPRSILVNVCLAPKQQPWIFVENLDSFILLSELGAPFHVIYCEGFKLSSSRIRNRSSVSLSYSSTTSKEVLDDFERSWFDGGQEQTFFWGDLDFSGLSIFLALKKVFPELELWRPAYSVMLAALHRGHNWTCKGEQLAPSLTGNIFIDTVIVPEIMRSKRFLDQEWVSRTQLYEILFDPLKK
ncbi:DUF2220 family protein [Simiduia curdlanivorans]|uniref:Wadjet anti-phage system protein JetD domain-containing protein n=1 Tax=Simiduia curdlanivorans TaxID=1492769 RepID=A0ABV8VAK3_9GAMM|nr:Wadjet anti-phage system protein JetD domain-containing protein [Simiduia curdlanivorans]MDN3639432.1 DUF2220 family protein [Simiduia curdlanivorans]